MLSFLLGSTRTCECCTLRKDLTCEATLPVIAAPSSPSVGIEIERRHTADQRQPITREYKQRKLNHRRRHYHQVHRRRCHHCCPDVVISVRPPPLFSPSDNVHRRNDDDDDLLSHPILNSQSRLLYLG